MTGDTLSFTDAIVGATGAVVSSMKVNAAVPVFPNASVWLATMVCVPSNRPVGVNDHTPAPFEVVVPRTVVPSVSVTSALASLVPVSASLEVTLSLAEDPVSVARFSVSIGPMVLKVKITGALVPVLPATSVSLATILWVPLPNSVTLVLHKPPLPTVAVASGVGPLSNNVTVVPMSATSTVPDIVWAAWLVGPPAVVIDTTGAVVSMVTAWLAVVRSTLPAVSTIRA